MPCAAPVSCQQSVPLWSVVAPQPPQLSRGHSFGVRLWRSTGFAALRSGALWASGYKLRAAQSTVETSAESPADEHYHVFLSHAGAQKRIFVDYLNRDLGSVRQQTSGTFNVFFDEHSLRPGQRDKAWPKIEKAAQHAEIVVFVLSHQFVRSFAPMQEMEIALTRARRDPSSVHLLPVFLLPWENCKNYLPHYLEDPPVDSKGSPLSSEQLLLWADNLKELSENTGRRLGQTDGFETALVNRTVTDVVEQLKGRGIIRGTYNWSAGVLLPAMALRKEPAPLVGRRKERAQLLRSLKKHGAAVVWGPPGEGKTRLATEAALKLHREQGSGVTFAIRVEITAGEVAGTIAALQSGDTPTEGINQAEVCQELFARHLVPKLIRREEGMRLDSDTTWAALEPWLLKDPHSKLLAFENAEELTRSNLKEGFEMLLQQLQSRGIRLLVTSRCALGVDLQGAEQLLLSSFCPGDARKFLRRKIGSGKATDVQLDVLAPICCHNPLVMGIIGGLIQGGKCTAAEVIYDAAAGLLAIDMCEGDSSSGVARRLNLERVSVSWLQRYLPSEQHRDAAALSLFEGVFDAEAAHHVIRSNVSTDALGDPGPSAQCKAEHKRAVQLLRDLRGLSVLQQMPDAAVPAHSMHRLVRVIAQLLWEAWAQHERQAAHQRICELLQRQQAYGPESVAEDSTLDVEAA